MRDVCEDTTYRGEVDRSGFPPCLPILKLEQDRIPVRPASREDVGQYSTCMMTLLSSLFIVSIRISV